MANTDDDKVVQHFDVNAPAANDVADDEHDVMASGEHLSEEELAEEQQLAALAMGDVKDASPEAMAHFVERIKQFLMGVCPNPFVLSYLSQCSEEDAFTVCQEIASVHSRIAVNALYAYVRTRYPEITDPEAIDQKVLEVETKSPLSWKPADLRGLDIEGESLETKPAAVLSVNDPATSQWVPLYNFGVFLKEVGPDIDGTEVHGYLPAVTAHILVKAPTLH